jgi:hypothetical protein
MWWSCRATTGVERPRRRRWLDALASGATRSPSVRVARLPGSHNNPYTHPRTLAEVVTADMRADP